MKASKQNATVNRTVVVCPNCQAKLGVREGVEKTHVTCPKCAERVSVEASASADLPAVQPFRQADPKNNSNTSGSLSVAGIAGAIVAGAAWGLLLLAGGSLGIHFTSAILGAAVAAMGFCLVVQVLETIVAMPAVLVDEFSEELTGRQINVTDCSAVRRLVAPADGVCGLLLLVAAAVGAVAGWHAALRVQQFSVHVIALASFVNFMLGYHAAEAIQRLAKR